MAEQLRLEQKFLLREKELCLNEEGVIEGYASLFGQVDQGGDLVMRGAYTASLKRLSETGGRVRMLWQHDPSEPVGLWEEVKEDARGLRVRGRLLPQVARAREAQALISAGALDGLSIGYRVVKSSKNTLGQRVLSEVDLWEISLVTFPMQREARVEVKAGGLVPLLNGLTAQVAQARRHMKGGWPPISLKEQA